MAIQRHGVPRRYIVAEMDGTVVHTAAVLEVESLKTVRLDPKRQSITLVGEVKAVKQVEITNVEAFARGVVATHMLYRDTDGFDYDGDLTGE
jgi:hypothetical protein